MPEIGVDGARGIEGWWVRRWRVEEKKRELSRKSRFVRRLLTRDCTIATDKTLRRPASPKAKAEVIFQKDISSMLPRLDSILELATTSARKVSAIK